MSQQVLQDRVERLERLVEDLTAFSLSNHGSQHVRRNSSSATSPFSSFDDYSDIPADAGNQVFGPGNSYHMGPDSWMNMDHLGYSPHHLLNMCSEDDAEQRSTWTMSLSHPRPKDMSHFHLPVYKEDVMIHMFFDHVEPFIRINHQGYFWQLVGEFRAGTCASGREVESLMFATQYITASVLPAALIQEKLGLVKSDLIDHLQRATEFAFDQANIMRSRSTVLFNALLYYIVSSITPSTALPLINILDLPVSYRKLRSRFHPSWPCQQHCQADRHAPRPSLLRLHSMVRRDETPDVGPPRRSRCTSLQRRRVRVGFDVAERCPASSQCK